MELPYPWPADQPRRLCQAQEQTLSSVTGLQAAISWPCDEASDWAKLTAPHHPAPFLYPLNDCVKVTEKALTSRQAQNLKETGTGTCFLAFFCQSYRMDIQVRSATTWLRKIVATEQWGKLGRKLRQMNEHSEWAPHLCIHCLRLQGISSGRKLGHGYLLLKV